MAAKRKIGRPISPAKKGARWTMAIIGTSALKVRMVKAARANERTLSQEGAFRLEQSFRDDRIIELLSEIKDSIDRTQA